MTASLPLSGYGTWHTIPGRSVETHWFPLTPEHGFPSLSYKAKDAPLLPAAAARGMCRFSHPSKKKSETARADCLRRKTDIHSYGGITRIRFQGRRSHRPLSLLYKLPLSVRHGITKCSCLQRRQTELSDTRFRDPAEPGPCHDFVQKCVNQNRPY